MLHRRWGSWLLLVFASLIATTCGASVRSASGGGVGSVASVGVFDSVIAASFSPEPVQPTDGCLPQASPTPSHASSGAESGVRESLGPCINSEFVESQPRFMAAGRLFFVRSGSPENVGGADGGEDIWYADRTEEGGWTEARNVGTPLNTSMNNSVVSVSADGGLVLLGNIYRPDGQLEEGFSILRRDDEGWGRPEPLDIDDWYSHSRWVSASLSADGSALVFHAERDDGVGGTDLYVSFRTDSGVWSAPLSLGDDVNTPGDEITPFLAADGETLYFSTDGRGGFGGHDIFVTQRLDESWQRWSEPENLGERFNSPGFDAYFVIPEGDEYGYLASTSGATGGSDLFRVPLRVPEPVIVSEPEPEPEPTVIVRGRVLDDETDAPIGGATVRYRTSTDSSISGQVHTDEASGEFELVLPEEAVYTLEAEAERFLGVSVSIHARLDEETNESSNERGTIPNEIDLRLVPADAGTSIVLRNVYFDFASATLSPESEAELERVRRLLHDNPEIRVEVQGHTDNVGSVSANDRISTSRAQSVRAYLIDHGIEPARIEARGYGSRHPIATNETEEGRQLNRRVELQILDDTHSSIPTTDTRSSTDRALITERT